MLDLGIPRGFAGRSFMPPSRTGSKELLFRPRSQRPAPCMFCRNAASPQQRTGLMALAERPASARATAIAAVLALVGLVMPLASNGTVIALFVLALLTLSIEALRRWLRNAPRALFFGLLLLAVWAVVSAFWSPLEDPGKALRTVALFLPGVVLVAWMSKPDAAVPRHALLALMLLALAVFLFEALSEALLLRLLRGDPPEQAGFDLERIGRGVALFAPLLWPAAVSLHRRSLGLAVAFFTVGAMTVVLLPMNAAILGLFLGAVFFVATLAAPRTVMAALFTAFALYAAAAPWLSRDVVTIESLQRAGIELPSAQIHRIGIWNFAAERALQHAPWGAGFDAARVIGREGIRLESLRPQLGIAPPALPLHPHNAVLQVWLELGILGVVALVLTFGGLLQALARADLDRWARAAGVAAVLTVLPPFVMNFGIWQAWWLAGLWLVAALAAAFLRRPEVTQG